MKPKKTNLCCGQPGLMLSLGVGTTPPNTPVTRREHEGTSGGTEIFCFLIWEMVTRCAQFVKMHLAVSL